MRLAILALLFVPTLAAGQVRGDSIRVRLNDGQLLEGELLSLDSVSIGVRRQSDNYTFPMGGIREVEVWDRKSRLREIGLRGVGGAFGMWMLSREFLWGETARPVTGSVAGDVAVGAAAGAVIGFALLRKSPGEWKEIRVRGSPSGIGLSLAVAWP